MFSNHMNDEVASISFNLNKFVQNKANIEYNYCHKKGHFANKHVGFTNILCKPMWSKKLH